MSGQSKPFSHRRLAAMVGVWLAVVLASALSCTGASHVDRERVQREVCRYVANKSSGGGPTPAVQHWSTSTLTDVESRPVAGGMYAVQGLNSTGERVFVLLVPGLQGPWPAVTCTKYLG